MKGMQLFDNYEEDGQLSLFSADYDDWDDDWVETPEETGEAMTKEADAEEKNVIKSERIKSGNTTKAKAAAGSTDSAAEPKIGEAVDTYEKAVAGLEITNSGPTVRVKYCASCGKLLFVKEETAGFQSECNNCGIKYFQKL